MPKNRKPSQQSMYKNKRRNKNKRHLSGKYQKKLRFYQNCLKKNPTLSEIRFRYALCKYFRINFEFDWQKGTKLPFREQRQFHFPKQNKGYIVDFYIPKYKIAFEVDGDSHIGKEKYDKIRDRLLTKRKIKVFRISNENTVDVDYSVEFIRSSIEGRKPKKVKLKKRPFINLSRAEELKMQEEHIKKHGVTIYTLNQAEV